MTSRLAVSERFRMRTATPSDAAALARIRVASWRAGYRGILPDDLLAQLDVDELTQRWATILAEAPNRGHHVEFVTAADQLVGYAAIGPYRSAEVEPGRPREDTPPAGELAAFYLHPDAWGTGAADPLIDRAEALLAERGWSDPVLWVLEQNHRARRFYERHGWRPDGIVGSVHLGGVATPDLRYCKNLTS